jgi:hypothetical protein
LWKYKGFALPKDLPLIAAALVKLLYYETLIRSRPLPAILTNIREANADISPVLSAEQTEKILDKLWRACGFWMARVLKNPRPCLRRSLVLYDWCKKHGVESKVIIGVDKENDILKGHAWLYVQGEVFREDAAELAKNYTVMLEG